MTLRSLCDQATDEIVARLISGIPDALFNEFDDIDIPALVAENRRYVERYGLGCIELRKYRAITAAWGQHQAARPNIPIPGDRVTLTATGSTRGGSRVFTNALIINPGWMDGGADEEVCICTQPYIPFITEGADLSRLDVSGGYYEFAPAAELRNPEPCGSRFTFFGQGARVDGGVQLTLPARRWELTSDLFY